jgi:hypothetical protein
VLEKDGEDQLDRSCETWRVNEERNILHTMKRRTANCVGHILRRNWLLKHVIEGKIERRIDVTWRRGRRRKQLMNDLKEKRGFFKLKEEAIDRTVWRTWSGSGNGPVLRQTTKWILVRGVGVDKKILLERILKK